jgi:hypothetical protein
VTPDTWTVIAAVAIILTPAGFLAVSDIRYRLKGHAERRKARAVLFGAMGRAEATEKGSTEEKWGGLMDEYSEVCPVCHGRAGKRPDGTLFPHQRYLDGGGGAAGLSHELVTCEGGGE